MATLVGVPSHHVSPRREDFAHRLRLRATWFIAISVLTTLAIYGYSYYMLGMEDRPLSTLHLDLRPSGRIGLRLGMLGFAMYCVLFIYPLRKRWRWLGSIGKTRHWLDFHVLVGICAPILITFHASFKFQGLAGVAYWIMIIVALSGFIGRYIYAQIPRSLNADQLTANELETQGQELAAQIARQDVFRAEDFAPLLRVPSAAEIRSMPMLTMFWTMLCLDLSRPLLTSALRRRVLRGADLIFTLGGLRPSSNRELEEIISNVWRQSWLRGKTAFLARVQKVFHLWHVVHRPFSYSFAALVTIHVAVVILLGYF